MISEIRIATRSRTELVDITSKVRDVVKASRVVSGICQVFIPHTTAGVTINENADPSVRQDILAGLERIVPASARYSHSEGNADAHIKSSIVGTDRTVFVEGGVLRLGTWQGIYFCEFDGPRQRNIIVRVTKG